MVPGPVTYPLSGMLEKQGITGHTYGYDVLNRLQHSEFNWYTTSWTQPWYSPEKVERVVKSKAHAASRTQPG